LTFPFVTSPALLDPLKDFRECPCRQCHNEVERVISKSVGRPTLTEPVMERFSISSSQSLTLAQPTAVQWDQSQQAVCLGPSRRLDSHRADTWYRHVSRYHYISVIPIW
jgi:hypothetical protein